MTPQDYFKFILSLYPSNGTNYLTEEDLNELSILFYRFLTLKVHERNAFNENKVLNPNFLKHAMKAVLLYLNMLRYFITDKGYTLQTVI